MIKKNALKKSVGVKSVFKIADFGMVGIQRFIKR